MINKEEIKMSKHNNNYHNYQNYQKKNDNAKVEENKMPEKEEVKEEIIHSIMDDYMEEEVSVEEVTPIKGVVVNCQKLRVRKAASPDAGVLCEIAVNAEVVIDEKKSTNEFYKVCTEAGVEGYCMKQFIAVK